jgi:hypothetical protein
MYVQKSSLSIGPSTTAHGRAIGLCKSLGQRDMHLFGGHYFVSPTRVNSVLSWGRELLRRFAI